MKPVICVSSGGLKTTTSCLLQTHDVSNLLPLEFEFAVLIFFILDVSAMTVIFVIAFFMSVLFFNDWLNKAFYSPTSVHRCLLLAFGLLITISSVFVSCSHSSPL